jgi:hypothetical protein
MIKTFLDVNSLLHLIDGFLLIVLAVFVLILSFGIMFAFIRGMELEFSSFQPFLLALLFLHILELLIFLLAHIKHILSDWDVQIPNFFEFRLSSL